MNTLTFLCLIALAIIYTSTDCIKQFMFLTSSTIKSIALNVDIHHEYKEIPLLAASVPPFILAIICLTMITVYIYNKNKTSKSLKKK